MRLDEGSAEGGAGQFHTTRWTLVLVSAQNQGQAAQEALAELCQIYWYPLYAFVRRRGYSPDDSEDLTQGFFLDLLEHRALTRVDRLKGKFRSFLLASFQNYLSVEARAAHCLKRGGQQRFVHIDAESAENRYRLEPADCLSPERIFDARWAMALLDHSMVQQAEECRSKGKESQFEALKDFVGIGNETVEGSYDEAAKMLSMGVGTVKTLIHRLRKRYIEIVRQEVARTVSDPAEINSEIHALAHALIAAEGRTEP
jgi:DNA-directed RNA polymerase specialized sigma24 family protein